MIGPAMISDETKARFGDLVRRYPEKRSALIPILHEVQAEAGYLSPEAIEWVAGFLGLSPADVMSVASFYDMLNLEPVGKHMIYVCQNLSCALLGAERLIRHLETRLGIRMGETSGRALHAEADGVSGLLRHGAGHSDQRHLPRADDPGEVRRAPGEAAGRPSRAVEGVSGLAREPLAPESAAWHSRRS